VCKEARRLDANEVELGTIAEHAELRRWYEGLGFQAKDTRRFEHLPFTVLMMSREL
jgi:hypothetical protein